MPCKTIYICPECGDKLIHQTKRTYQESSSAYGQHIYDDYPHTFYYCDIDGAQYKNATRVLRILEHKRPGQQIKPSEKTILGLLQKGIDTLIPAGIVHPDSGVYIVRSEPPWETAEIQSIKTGMIYILSGESLSKFETGEWAWEPKNKIHNP